jgi:hypothetical protein
VIATIIEKCKPEELRLDEVNLDLEGLHVLLGVIDGVPLKKLVIQSSCVPECKAKIFDLKNVISVEVI